MEAASFYQPLDTSSHEIRLLRILAPQNDTETLDCLLEIVSLDTSPEYFGLSYEWGKYSNKQPHPKVLVNSQEISVTANLALAISRLRELGNAERYWIDAICINQEDNIERAQQVRIMTRIYEKSSGVYSWLGLEDEKSDKAVEIVQEFHQFHQACPVPPSPDFSVAWKMLSWTRQRLRDPSYQEQWEALHALFQRTYWKRVWIIQEIVVIEKSRGVRLLCGTKEILFWPLHALVFFAGQGTFDAGYGSHLEHWWAISKRLGNGSLPIYAITRHAEAWGSQRLGDYNLGLLRLLGDYSRARCTDLRDKVYALLGVSLPYEGLELKINYSIPVWRVYLNAAQYIIRGSKSLEILIYHGEHSPELSNLPSWVPDWSGQHQDPPMILSTGFDACGSTIAETRFSSDGTRLTIIHSIILGTVTELNDGGRWGPRLENVLGRVGNGILADDSRWVTDELCRWLNFASRSIQRFIRTPGKQESGTFFLSPDQLARVFFDAVVSTLPPAGKPQTLSFEKFHQLCNYLCEPIPSAVQFPTDVTQEHVVEIGLALIEERKLCTITFSTPLSIEHPDTGQGRESGSEDFFEEDSQEESECGSICESQCSRCFPDNRSRDFPKIKAEKISESCSEAGSGSRASDNFEGDLENDFENDSDTGSGSDMEENSPAAVQEYWVKTIGICPPKRAMINDVAIVVRGCKHPLLVRKKEMGYELLGELYVHGVMFGEAMEGFPEMDIELI